MAITVSFLELFSVFSVFSSGHFFTCWSRWRSFWKEEEKKKCWFIRTLINCIFLWVKILLKNYNKLYRTSKWSHLFLDGKTTHMLMINEHFKWFYLQLIDKTNFSLFLWSSKTFNLLCLLLFFCLIFLLFWGRAFVTAPALAQ